MKTIAFHTGTAERVVEHSLATRYLFSLCALRKGKYTTAESVLAEALTEAKASPDQDLAYLGAACFVMGEVHRHTNRKARAVEYFLEALHFSPFLWKAYQALCDLGANAEAAQVFQLSPAHLAFYAQGSPSQQQQQQQQPPQQQQQQQSNQHPLQHHQQQPSSLQPPQTAARPSAFSAPGSVAATPANPGVRQPQPRGSSAHPSARGGFADSPAVLASQRLSFDTPAVRGDERTPAHSGTGARSAFVTPDQSQSQSQSLGHAGGSTAGGASTGIANNNNNNNNSSIADRKRVRVIDWSAASNGSLRRSSRLSFGGAATAPPAASASALPPSTANNNNNNNINLASTNTNANAGGGLASAVQPRPRNLSGSSVRPLDLQGLGAEGGWGSEGGAAAELAAMSEVPDTAEGAAVMGRRGVVALLQLLGTALERQSQFQCAEAVQLFLALPQAQRETSWVLTQIGRAYFEIAQYGRALEAFQVAIKTDPHFVQGMELYSTILWQLRKETELAFLSQRVLEENHLDPASWCVVGNCFSLQKDHETALKFFRRATQLDPGCTYAYTLSGHEYLVIEDYEKALACFRSAIRTDERHYNAWYGLGVIYLRQEKFDLSLYHFRRALSINPNSSVLYAYVGVVLAASGRHEEALAMLHTALDKDSRSPLARFRLAGVLVSLGRYHDALHHLEILRDSAPREASVHFAIGKCHKRLGALDAALAAFNAALSYAPSPTSAIKRSIEKLHMNTEDSDDDDDHKFI
jgi:anaphase-promoting complex subunit 3